MNTGHLRCRKHSAEIWKVIHITILLQIYALLYFDDCIALMQVCLHVPGNKKRTKCHNISNTRRESC